MVKENRGTKIKTLNSLEILLELALIQAHSGIVKALSSLLKSVLVDFNKLLDDIIVISDSIRFVFVTNEQGKIVYNKVSTNSFLLDPNQASVLGVDMQILKKLLKLYDEI